MHISPVARKDQIATISERNRRIYNFLQEHPIGVLATIDPNGNPHAVVVYFSVDKDFTLSFITKRETKKHDNLKRNNRTMIVTYEPNTQTTVQVTGIANEVSGISETARIFSNTIKSSKETSEAGIPPISKLNAGQYVAYHLRPLQIRMAMFIRPDSGGYDMYDTLDFIA